MLYQRGTDMRPSVRPSVSLYKELKFITVLYLCHIPGSKPHQELNRRACGLLPLSYWKMISSLVMSTNRSAGSRRVISSFIANCLFHARLVRLLWVVISPDVTRIVDRWYKIAVLTHLRYPVSHGSQTHLVLIFYCGALSSVISSLHRNIGSLEMELLWLQGPGFQHLPFFP